MLNKDLCKQCENLLEYVMEYGTGNANMARCIFGISDLTILKCSHFKKKIALDKQLRTDIKKSLSHGKNPRKQPKDVRAWKTKGICDFCENALKCTEAKRDGNVNEDCKDWRKDLAIKRREEEANTTSSEKVN